MTPDATIPQQQDPGDQSDDAGAGDSESLQLLAEARERLAQIPAEVVVTNHAMGLYELAAIHLTAEPPNLEEARLAIDSLGFLVEGLGDRLGESAETLQAALSNIRLVFVQRS